MKYCFVGAGGVGCGFSAQFALAGKDVTLIARGENLAALKENGLKVIRDDSEYVVKDINFASADEYAAMGEKPDVLFVTVKTYSVESAAPDIERIAGPDTVIIPIMNGICTGDLVKRYVNTGKVIDGTCYIVSKRVGPGAIRQYGTMMRIVFGDSGDTVSPEILEAIRDDLKSIEGVKAVLSDNIGRDTVRKFAYVSSVGAAGLYYDCTAGAMKKYGEEREMLKALNQEIVDISNAMGIVFDIDIVQKSLDIVDATDDDATTSMQRDVLAGVTSEFEGQIVEPVRLGKKYGVPMPEYEKVAAKYGFVDIEG